MHRFCEMKFSTGLIASMSQSWVKWHQAICFSVAFWYSEDGWLISASVNWVINSSENGLVPMSHKSSLEPMMTYYEIDCQEQNFSEMLNKICRFSFKKMHFKIVSVKWCPFCSCHNVVIRHIGYPHPACKLRNFMAYCSDYRIVMVVVTNI